MKIVFDLDGTLIDSAPDINAAGNAALAAEGLPGVSLAQTRSFIGNGAGVYVKRLEGAVADRHDPARVQRMRAGCAPTSRSHPHEPCWLISAGRICSNR